MGYLSDAGELMKELSKDCQNGKHVECLRYYCDCSCHQPNKKIRKDKILTKAQDDELKRINKLVDENESFHAPEIRTRFLKGKIKGARLGKLSSERISDALASLHLGAQRYKNKDFRYIAELMRLEDMLYSERQPGFTGGMGWGIGIEYLTNKYPKEYLAMLDELDPKGDHRERYKKEKIEEKIATKKWKEKDREWLRDAKKWWQKNGGII
jgi:hypothetical protein